VGNTTRSGVTASYSKEMAVANPQYLNLRKKKVHRILQVGLLDQASAYYKNFFGGYDYEMGNTKLHRPAFRF